MSWFYFDLTNGHDTLRDEKGVEAVDLNEATDAARAVLEEMHDNGEAPAEMWSLVIRDEGGAVLSTMFLGEGTRIRPSTLRSSSQA